MHAREHWPEAALGVAQDLADRYHRRASRERHLQERTVAEVCPRRVAPGPGQERSRGVNPQDLVTRVGQGARCDPAAAAEIYYQAARKSGCVQQPDDDWGG